MHPSEHPSVPELAATPSASSANDLPPLVRSKLDRLAQFAGDSPGKKEQVRLLEEYYKNPYPLVSKTSNNLGIRGAKIVFDVDDPFFPPTVITIRGTVDEKASEEQGKKKDAEANTHPLQDKSNSPSTVAMTTK